MLSTIKSNVGRKLWVVISRSPLIKGRSHSFAQVPVAAANMSTTSNLDLRGVYPPIATPFDDKENVSYEKLKHNMDRWNKMPFRGYVVQGSNGEYAYLDADERVDMVARVRQLAPSDKLIIAGSGCESTRDTVKTSIKMAAAGADAVLVVTPCYYKGRMTNEALEQHYRKVADASPVPVLLYSVPANTGLDLDPGVIISLADHPNIIGLKDSGGDIAKIGNVIYKTRQNDFQVLAGSASFLYPALSLGAVGGVCALANVLGDEVCQVQKLYEEGNHAEASELQRRLIAPNAGVTKRFGVPGLKEAMSWFGFYGGPLRSPLQPLNDSERGALRQSFIGGGFLTK